MLNIDLNRSVIADLPFQHLLRQKRVLLLDEPQQNIKGQIIAVAVSCWRGKLRGKSPVCSKSTAVCPHADLCGLGSGVFWGWRFPAGYPQSYSCLCGTHVSFRLERNKGHEHQRIRGDSTSRQHQPLRHTSRSKRKPVAPFQHSVDGGGRRVYGSGAELTTEERGRIGNGSLSYRAILPGEHSLWSSEHPQLQGFAHTGTREVWRLVNPAGGERKTGVRKVGRRAVN